ncbi:hypothetical protein BJX99DRAFT_258800 [Aspergillus californicus]
MALEFFHFFPFLPFDLRREIYMLATTPRVVHLQEEMTMDGDEFEEHLRTRLDLHPNPDLAYFAPNWRSVSPEPSTQPTLESFGVTSDQKPYQPWEPSPSTPEIPVTWLEVNPGIASSFIRESYLCSNAPIPGLLHTFSESRSVLQRWGYKLAFQTRRNGPRTWFNFNRDILFIDKDENTCLMNEDDLLTRSPWSLIGQFHSNDLTKIRRLALGKSGPLLFPWKRHPYLLNAIQLFPHLEELQIVQWTQEDLFSWRDFATWASKHPWYRDQEAHDLPGELVSLAVEEIDALIPLLSETDGLRTDMPMAGAIGEMLRFYKKRQRSATELGFIEHQQESFERRLATNREEIQYDARKNEPGLSTFSWQIPQVRAVHIILPSMVPLLVHERHIAWEKFLKMKRNRAHRASKTLTPDLPLSALRTLVGNISYEEIHDIYLGPFSSRHMHGGNIDSMKTWSRNVRAWWAEQGVVAPPGEGDLL